MVPCMLVKHQAAQMIKYFVTKGIFILTESDHCQIICLSYYPSDIGQLHTSVLQFGKVLNTGASCKQTHLGQEQVSLKGFPLVESLKCMTTVYMRLR